MSLLQEPQCLRCGSTLPLKVLWDFARLNDKHILPGLNLLTRSGLLKGKIGIECPNCGATDCEFEGCLYAEVASADPEKDYL